MTHPVVTAERFVRDVVRKLDGSTTLQVDLVRSAAEPTVRLRVWDRLSGFIGHVYMDEAVFGQRWKVCGELLIDEVRACLGYISTPRRNTALVLMSGLGHLLGASDPDLDGAADDARQWLEAERAKWAKYWAEVFDDG